MRCQLLRDGQSRHRQPGEAAGLGDFRDKHYIPHMHRAGYHHNSVVPGSAVQVKIMGAKIGNIC